MVHLYNALEHPPMTELEYPVTLVNCVGNGKVNAEIDLQELMNDLPCEEKYQQTGGLFFKFEEGSPILRLSRSGNYYISGASSEESLYKTQSQLLTLLSDFGIIKEPTDGSFQITNKVFTCDIGQEVELNSAAILFGFEKVGYEPEQFPGLVYRPEEYSCVALIFSSGKLTITGGTLQSEAEAMVEYIVNQFESSEVI